jgi:hypothetical protein
VGDTDSLLCEFRLFQGLFHTVVPWWGIRRAQEINALGETPEMVPWALHTKYDRPVARRLVEDAGVPREAFGIRKKNTSSNVEFLWPRTAEARSSFVQYLRERGLHAPSGLLVGLLRWVARADNLLAMNLTSRIGLDLRLRQRLRFRANSLLFQWANEELKRHYVEGLRSAGIEPAQTGASERL